VLREDVLPALNMTQTEFARRLGGSRLSVSELLLGKRALPALRVHAVSWAALHSLKEWDLWDRRST
jgi:plasmid maintenance system antidote protein VapI